jgi:hypothetical protein
MNKRQPGSQGDHTRHSSHTRRRANSQGDHTRHSNHSPAGAPAPQRLMMGGAVGG